VGTAHHNDPITRLTVGGAHPTISNAVRYGIPTRRSGRSGNHHDTTITTQKKEYRKRTDRTAAGELPYSFVVSLVSWWLNFTIAQPADSMPRR
jgi:hypothetical protein